MLAAILVPVEGDGFVEEAMRYFIIVSSGEDKWNLTVWGSGGGGGGGGKSYLLLPIQDMSTFTNSRVSFPKTE